MTEGHSQAGIILLHLRKSLQFLAENRAAFYRPADITSQVFYIYKNFSFREEGICTCSIQVHSLTQSLYTKAS